MLQTVVQVAGSTCRFEILEGEWPQPIELHWTASEPVLTMMFFEPSYHVEGRMLGSSNEDFIELGRTFMLPPDHVLQGRGSGGKMRAARCFFDRFLYAKLFGPACSFTEKELSRMFDISSSTISLLMKRLMQEAMSPGHGSEMLVESIASTLLIECGREVFAKDSAKAQNCHAGLRPHHMRLVEEHLDGIEIGIPKATDLAELCGFSAHYFAKLFRQATGQSLGRYIAEWRLRRAQRLLTETSLPLKEVAYRLGFTNAANFSTAFRKETHQTPGAYRRLRFSSPVRQEGARMH